MLSTIVFVLLARLVTPAELGVVAFSGIAVAFLSTLLEQALGQPLIQAKELDDEQVNTSFWFSVGLALVLSGLVVALAPRLAAVFATPSLEPVTRALSAAVFLAGVQSVPAALLQRNLDFRALSIRTLLSATVGGSLGVALAILGAGMWALVAQTLTTAAIGTASIFLLGHFRPRRDFTLLTLRPLRAFAGHAAAGQLLNFVNRRSDDLVIGVVLGPRALAFYSVGYRLLLVMTEMLTSTISNVALPTFSRMSSQPERMKRAYSAAISTTSLVSIPAFSGMAIVAPELILVAFGPQWSPAVPVMRTLCAIGALHSVLYFGRSALLALGRPAAVTRMSTIDAVANLAAFLVAVRWGIVAVAAAYVARGYLLAWIPIGAVRRALGVGFKELGQSLAPSVAASGVMAITLVLFRFYHVPRGDIPDLLMNVLIGIVSYAVALAGFGRQSIRRVAAYIGELRSDERRV